MATSLIIGAIAYPHRTVNAGHMSAHEMPASQSPLHEMRYSYETNEAALGAASALGCGGITHSHGVNSKRVYMPCHTHAQYVMALSILAKKPAAAPATTTFSVRKRRRTPPATSRVYPYRN